jgi:uncharacterized membrane protein
MELQTTRKPACDLLGVLALSLLYLIAVLTRPGGWLQALFGLPFVLIVSGYVLLAAIHRDSAKTALSERLALSCVLSLAIVMFAAMSLNAFRRLHLAWLLCALGALIAAGCAYAYRGRKRMHWNNAGHIAHLRSRWKKPSALTSLIDVLFVACLCTTLCLMVDVIAFERTSVPTTAFYLLSGDGKAGGYVRAAECGCGFPVTLGIVNNEEDVKDYSIGVRIGDQRRRIVARVTLQPRQTWEERFEVTVERCGTVQAVVFDLLEGQSESPYRTVYQRVRTTPACGCDDVLEELGRATREVGTSH